MGLRNERRRGRDGRPLLVPGELCCDIERFPPHARVLLAARDRERLERLCRIAAEDLAEEQHGSSAMDEVEVATGELFESPIDASTAD